MQTRIVEFARHELGVNLFPGQAEVLSAYYASGRPNWLLLAGRRGGKSLLSDVIACYESVVPDFSDVLRPGEERYVITVSVRQDNASLHIRNMARMLRHSRALARLVREEQKERLVLSNGVTIVSLPASARAGRGWTASTLILDELAHFVDTEGNASADAVLDAYMPTLATFGERGRTIVTTTPAARVGPVYDLFDRALDDWHITRRATQELNPRVSQKVIDRARERDPESAAVEYDAEFYEPVQSYLNGEAIDAAATLAILADAGEPGARYAMAIDPATLADRYAFVLGHRSGERVVLDYAHIIRPPVDPNQAEALLLDLVHRFRPFVVRCDTAATVSRLKSQVPALEYTPFTRPKKLEWYGALKETLNFGNLVLPAHADLIAELKALQIRNGVDIAAPKSGRVTHDDLADCAALVVDALRAHPAPASATAERGSVHAVPLRSSWDSQYDPNRAPLYPRETHKPIFRR